MRNRSSLLLGALSLPLVFCHGVASAQDATVAATERYFEISSNVLNEPCLSYNGISYAAQFTVIDRGVDGLAWVLVSGAEISEIPADCVQVQQSVFTDDPAIPYVSYNVTNVIVLDDGVDTGLRYDIHSRADASRFYLGFSFDAVYERRLAEKVIVTGTASVSFPGPSSFPFERQEGDQWLGVNKNFDGSVSYDGEANEFSVSLDAENDAGDYSLTVRFDLFAFSKRNETGLVLVYPIEFHVI